MRQRTIKDQIFISGKGIHTGLNTNLTLKPEKEGYGIKFKRTDLNPPVIIEASLSNVFDTQRSTSLKKNEQISIKVCTKKNVKQYYILVSIYIYIYTYISIYLYIFLCKNIKTL